MDGSMLNHSRRCQIRPIVQSEAAECGLMCLLMIRSSFGVHDDVPAARKAVDISSKGTTVNQILEIGKLLGLKCTGLKTKLEYLEHASLPCILHWEFNHFVVLAGVNGNRYEVFDPATGRTILERSEVSSRFTGVVLEAALEGPLVAFVNKDKRDSANSGFGTLASEHKKKIAGILAVAILVELIGVTIPYYTRIMVDHVVPDHDFNLLALLVVGFIGLTTIQLGFAICRIRLASWISTRLGAEWTLEVLRTLLRLPVRYFERRSTGGIISRFTSVQLVQDTLTSGAVQVVLDVLVCSVAAIAALLLNAWLSLFLIFNALLFAAVKFYFFGAAWRANEQYLNVRAKQQGDIIESIRGIQTIKIFNREDDRERRARNFTVEAAEKQVVIQRIRAQFAASNTWFVSTQRILAIGAGAASVADGSLSLGSLFEYVMYVDLLSGRVGPLIDGLLDFRLISLHSERVSDITSSEPEPEGRHVVGESSRATVNLKDVSFRYSKCDPWVLRGLSLQIEEGESIAITGPSGSGKSTLVKILTGLAHPTKGEVEFFGRPLDCGHVVRDPSLVGAVLQGDRLFAGSIAQNISMFDAQPRLDDMLDAARNAGIHSDIVSMPMGYETLVGDMGSTLSGGQRQRIMLARALYWKPRILILDEATSALDRKVEAEICERISGMDMTRIMFAHREETLRSATRVLDIREIQSGVILV